MKILIDHRRIGDMDLALAQSRYFVERAAYEAVSTEFKQLSAELLVRIDGLLADTVFALSQDQAKARAIMLENTGVMKTL